MLLGTVLLWALNITVTKYVLQHGFQPLAYATIRYFAATTLFWAFTYARERSFRIERRDIGLVLVASFLIFVNQLGFVYGVDDSNASTVALILGTTPIFIGIIATLAKVERVQRSFWVAAVVSFVGVGFVAWGSGGFSGHVRGDVLALFTAATWAAYSVTIAPLMRRYSPFRISALVLAIGWIPLAIAGCEPDDEPVVPLRHGHLGRLRLRGRRPALPDEHPLVHGDQPGRAVAGLAVREPAAVLRGALRAPDPRRAPDRYELVGAAAIFAGIAARARPPPAAHLVCRRLIN